MAKLLKDIISEVAQPESEGDKNFKDKHVVQDTYPPFQDGKKIWDILNGNTMKQDHSKISGYKDGQDQEVYEENEEEITEGIIDSLRQVVESDTPLQITFKDGKVLDVDVETASKLISVSEELADKNLEIFIKSLEESDVSFMKMLDFAATVSQ